MRAILPSLVLIAALAFASGADAASRIDCPLRNQAYSIDTPLIDILLKPEARALVEQQSPGAWERVPARWQDTGNQSFGAIVSLRWLSRMMQFSAEDLARIDAGLHRLRLTNANREARCRRYDIERPQLANSAAPVRVLLFEKITGFRDGPSVSAGRAAFVDIAARHGWALTISDRGAVMRPEILRQFQVVVWNNVSGDVLTVSQRRAFQRYIETGGAFVGVHGSGGDPVYWWGWYADTLIGARFLSHPESPQFQAARVNISTSASSSSSSSSSSSGIGADLAPGWTMTDEWYSFRSNPRASGAQVIASLDESTYSPLGHAGLDLHMGDHPIAWTKCIGRGRSFYSAIGHMPETYSEPHYARMLDEAMVWAVSGRCQPG